MQKGKNCQIIFPFPLLKPSVDARVFAYWKLNETQEENMNKKEGG